MDTDHVRDVEIFIALHILGTVLFVLVTISAFIAQHRGGSRHPTFFSFCFSWIVFCVSYALLFFAGQQTWPIPDKPLCTVHSALVYAAPPLASSATVSLVTHLMLNILLALSTSAEKRRSQFVSTVLVITPWVIWVAVFVGVLLFGFHHPSLVYISPNKTFCILNPDTQLPKLTSIWATLLSIVLVAEEVVIGVLLRRNRQMLHGFGQSVTMAIRVAVFTILGIGAIAVALVYTVTNQRGIQFDLLIGAIPPGAAVIFGSQKDILQVWVFWKKYEYTPAQDATSHPAVLSTILSSRGTISVSDSQSGTRGTPPV